jgi:hypothetical protein
MLMSAIFRTRFAMLFVVLITTETLMCTPLQSFCIFLNLLTIILFSLLFFYHLAFESASSRGSLRISKLYLVALAVLPIIGAVQSRRVFGQDLLDGLLSDINYYMLFVIVYLHYCLENTERQVRLLEQTVVAIGIVSFVVIGATLIFAPDMEFSVPSFSGTSEYVFKSKNLTSPCIIWSAFVFLARYRSSGRYSSLALFLMFAFFPMFYSNARSYSAALAICLLVFFLRDLKTVAKANVAVLLIFSLLSFGVATASSSGLRAFLLEKQGLFENALSVVSGANGDDSSANVRVPEAELALNYFNENPVLGCGKIRESRKSEFLGEYFHSSDVGILGVLFNYGLVGLLVLGYQILVFAGRFNRPEIRDNPFFLGTSLFLLLLYIQSFFTGFFAYRIGMTFLLLGILLYGPRREGQATAGSTEAGADR